MNKKPPFDGGFVLVEVVIALLLMGAMMHGGTMILSHLHAQKCYHVTQERQEGIMKSLAAYAAIEGRLPWAADKEGREDAKTKRQIGHVPFQTLGLSAVYGQDGFGRPMQYFVASFCRLPPSVSPLERYCRALPHVVLQCRGVRPPKQDPIAVGVLSHGGRVCDCSKEGAMVSDLPGHKVLWATRNTLLTLYGNNSCALFHQPLPSPDGSIMRGFGR